MSTAYLPLTIDIPATRTRIEASKFKTVERYGRERGIAGSSMRKLLNASNPYPEQTDKWSRYQNYLKQLKEDGLLVEKFDGQQAA